MGWFSDIMGVVNKAVDKIPDESEREQIRGQMTIDIMKVEAEMEARILEQATLRYQKDLESGSWINMHIRAIIMLIYTVLVVGLPFVNVFFDKTINPQILDLYSTIAMLIYGFYFGGKSFEKATEIISLVKRGK